jgi:sugar phosphate isomerase/epimerase
MNDELGEAFAAVIREKKLVLTAHSKLPLTHSEEEVAIFKRDVDAIAKWQKKYGLLEVLSFDVAQDVRDNVMPYIEYVLGYEQFGKVALEDFGVTEAERAQIEPLKGNPRFGYLLDLGHMNIRIHGVNTEPINLFRNSPSECPKCDNPGYNEFLRAFRSKEFPIFEIHLHNNDGVGDLHQFLDVGTIDMRAIAAILKEIAFDGIVTIESVPRLAGYHYPESDQKILETLEYWKDCLK